MQGTMDGWSVTNFSGLLKALIGILWVLKNKCDYLGLGFLAVLMQATVRGRCEIVEGLESLVEAALLFISAVQRNDFNGVIGFQ